MGWGQFRESIADRFRHLRSSESLLRDTVGKRNEGFKRRGVLNFVGQINKILFGTLDENDAVYYNEQIRKFEETSDDLTDLLKPQVCVIKTTLEAFNDRPTDTEHNDKLVQKGLFDIKTYLDSSSAETAGTLSTFEAKFLIEKHITQVNNAPTVL
jgi:hypothetical protein